jgi:hypothetical protein
LFDAILQARQVADALDEFSVGQFETMSPGTRLNMLSYRCETAAEDDSAKAVESIPTLSD